MGRVKKAESGQDGGIEVAGDGGGDFEGDFQAGKLTADFAD